MAYCKDCGQEVGADGKFCESCGSRLSGSVCATKEPEGSPTAELVTYPCAYCGGTGEVDVGETVTVYDTCPVCKGACEVRVPGDYVKCRACDGTGKEDVGDVLEVLERCGRCRGTGWAPPPPVYGQHESRGHFAHSAQGWDCMRYRDSSGYVNVLTAKS